MARKAFEKIMAGMEDALAYAEGDATRGVAHKVEIHEVDVAALRKRLGLSQVRFADTFGFSPKTLRNCALLGVSSGSGTTFGHSNCLA
jgi:putative transcriptional regulator